MIQADMAALPGLSPPSRKIPATSGSPSSLMALTPGAVTDEGTPNPPSSTTESAKTKNLTPAAKDEEWNVHSWSSNDVSIGSSQTP